MVAWGNRRCRILRNKQPTVFNTSSATLTAISTESFDGFVRPVPQDSATQASSLCLPRHLIALHAVHRTMAERGKLADISLFHGGFQTAVWIQRASRTQTFNGLWICIKTDISACGSRDFNFPINRPLCVTQIVRHLASPCERSVLPFGPCWPPHSRCAETTLELSVLPLSAIARTTKRIGHCTR